MYKVKKTTTTTPTITTTTTIKGTGKADKKQSIVIYLFIIQTLK